MSIFGFPGLLDKDAALEIQRRYEVSGSAVTLEMIDEYFNREAVVLYGFEELSEQDYETVLNRTELRDSIDRWLK